MSYLVVFILDNPDCCQNILDAWNQAGAKGMTILESAGIGRIQQTMLRDDLSIMPSLSDLLKATETHNRTLLSVVDDLDLAHSLVKVTQEIIGDLDQPNTGILFIAPLVEVYGLRKEPKP